MKSRFLRKDEIKDLRTRIQDALSLGDVYLPHGCEVEAFPFEEGELNVVNREPIFLIRNDGIIIPLLTYLLGSNSRLPRVIVDTRAVAHICHGADIFRPGIRDITLGFRVGQIVVVSEEKSKKPICVGVSLFDAAAMQKLIKGKVIRNVHYVGDGIWNFSKGFERRS